ncbi:MAG: type VI secretion system protein TssA [Acetobacteraceae bacterium]
MTDEVDLDGLLMPISGDCPSGSDPRRNFDPASRYFRLRDSRAEARAAERQADAASEGDEAPVPPWGGVLRLGLELLSTEAKDLEVAAWCTEALLRVRGLPGFSAGCALMQGLIEQFWDSLHPLPDEDGIASRIAPVAGLNGEGGEGTLIQPLRKITLFPRRDGSSLALWQYQQSAEVAGIGDAGRRAQRLAAGALPFEQVDGDAIAAGRDIFIQLRSDAVAATDAWRALSESLEARVGSDAPSTSRARDLLQEIVGIAERYAPADPASADTAEGETDRAYIPQESASALSANPRRIATREDALHMLDEIADFFRRTEPHSPLAYTLYEAVRRGRLTWPELLEEIVPDPDSRETILRSLGIRPLPPPE